MFLCVGEVRSLTSPDVRILAMTATISRTSRESIQKLLGMCTPIVYTMSPCKANIYYSVQTCDSVSDAFIPLADKHMFLRTKFECIIIFCQTIKDCSSIYLFFHEYMKQDMLEPPDAPDLLYRRLAYM